MSFFPHLPILIPYSPGLPWWWDPIWWIFQIVAMTGLVFYFNHLADEVDHARNREEGPSRLPGKDSG
ncbi:MAG: hypothetical protein M0Z53_08110 [Thermaerobacter sp.]|nr:hypothetical protein [Thermaerobacter sp.]